MYGICIINIFASSSQSSSMTCGRFICLYFNKNNMERNGFRSVITGGVIVLIGIVYLLFNVGILPADWRGIIISWQSLLILLGVVGICKRSYIGGTILLALGICFLLPDLSAVMGFTYSSATLHSVMWPTAIIIIGVMIMLHRHHHHHFKHCHRVKYSNGSKEGKIDYNLVMNGIDEVFLDPEFKGGEINTIMGGAKLDLRRTSLPEGDTVLKISSIFGGVTLLLPLDWNVEVHSDSILGGFADHRRINGMYTDRRLIIEASFIFGGGSIE